MSYRLIAEGVLVLHLGFILFVLLGAALAMRWRWLFAVHVPAVAWAIFIELTGGFCPLTYAENYLRHKAGQSGYAESFIEHYLVAIIYPTGLTKEVQLVLAVVVVAINVAIYGWLFHHRGKSNPVKG